MPPRNSGNPPESPPEILKTGTPFRIRRSKTLLRRARQQSPSAMSLLSQASSSVIPRANRKGTSTSGTPSTSSHAALLPRARLHGAQVHDRFASFWWNSGAARNVCRCFFVISAPHRPQAGNRHASHSHCCFSSARRGCLLVLSAAGHRPHVPGVGHAADLHVRHLAHVGFWHGGFEHSAHRYLFSARLPVLAACSLTHDGKDAPRVQPRRLHLNASTHAVEQARYGPLRTMYRS